MLTILIITAIYSISYTFNAHATPYPFDRTVITMPTPVYSRSVAEWLMSDFDKDGMVDAIYTHTSPSTTVSKTWGENGISSFTIHAAYAGTTGGNSIEAIKQNRIITMSYGGTSASVPCRYQINQWNLTDGTIIENMSLTSGNGGFQGHDAIFSSGTSGGNINKTIALVRCDNIGGAIVSRVTPSINITTANYVTTTSISHQHMLIWNGANCSPNCYFYNSTGIFVNNPTAPNTYLPIINTAYQDIATGGGISTSAFGSMVHSPTIKFYYNGFLYPTSSTFLASTATQNSIRIPLSTTTNPNLIMTLNFADFANNAGIWKITNPRWLMENSTSTYLATKDGATIYWTLLQPLLDQLDYPRVYTTFINDVSLTGSTALLTNPIPTTLSNVQVVYPNYTTVNIVTLNSPYATYPSGYGLKIQSDKIRYYWAEYENNNFGTFPNVSNYTALQTNTATHQALTLEIKNAFPDTAVRLRDPSMYLGISSYIWLEDTLQTDNTVTISLPANQCVYVDIKDISDNDTQWINIGILCNNGLTYKILPNTSEISFQFWTFPYGVNHIFNNTDNILQTQVRHTTTPKLK